MAARPHHRRIVNLDQLRSIGIIAHNLTEEDEVALAQFTHHMTNRGMMIRKIVLPEYADDLLDKFGFPKPEFSLLFTSYNYDLLIDATPMNDVFGLYVSLNTTSNLRTKYYDTTQPMQDINLSTYDLILRGEGPCPLSKYLTDLLNYLVQIRK